MNKRRYVFIGLIVLSLIGLLITGLLYFYKINYSFKRVNFANGTGGEYNLSFFKNHQVKKQHETGDYPKDSPKNVLFHPIDGDIGLAIYISNGISHQPQELKCNSNNGLGASVGFVIDGNKFCTRTSEGNGGGMYTGWYGKDGRWLLVQVYTGFDSYRALHNNDKEYAERILKVRAENYQKDIVKIIKSIDLANAKLK